MSSFPEPQACAIIGKGWSLDSAPWDRLNDLAGAWLGINEAALVMVKHARPGKVLIGVSTDEAPRQRQLACEGLSGWIPSNISMTATEHSFAYRAANPGAEILYLRWARTDGFLAERLPRMATTPSAVVAAARLGYRRAICVGLDGLFGLRPPAWALPSSDHPHGLAYARCVSEAAGEPLDRAEGIRYTAIDEDTRQAARWFGVELVAAG